MIAAAVLALAVAGSPGGPLVLAGGALGEDNEEVWRAVLAGRRDDAPVCVIPVASGVPRRSMRAARKTLRSYGGRETASGVLLRHDRPDDARDPKVVARLARCGGFWFTGGDQSRIVDVLRPGGTDSPALRAIAGVFRAGGVVAGSSAGCAMASDPMIGGGSSEEAFRAGVVREEGEGVWLRNGMGFLPGVLVDQHHFASGRFGRLVVALSDPAAPRRGLGVDEDTAVAVRDGEIAVLGRSVVVWVEAEAGAVAGRFWILPSGSRFRLDGRPGIPATHAEPAGDPPDPPAEIWKGAAFLEWLRGFAFSTGAVAEVGAAPGTLRIGKEKGFAASPAPRGFAAGPFTYEWEAPSSP